MFGILIKWDLSLINIHNIVQILQYLPLKFSIEEISIARKDKDSFNLNRLNDQFLFLKVILTKQKNSEIYFNYFSTGINFEGYCEERNILIKSYEQLLKIIVTSEAVPFLVIYSFDFSSIPLPEPKIFEEMIMFSEYNKGIHLNYIEESNNSSKISNNHEDKNILSENKKNQIKDQFSGNKKNEEKESGDKWECEVCKTINKLYNDTCISIFI